MSPDRLLNLPTWLVLPQRQPGHKSGIGSLSWLPGVALTLVGGWQGGWFGTALSAAGLLLAWVGLRWSQRCPDTLTTASTPVSTPDDDSTADTGQGGMHQLVRSLTDEWSKQLTLGRDANREGLERLLMTFSDLSTLMATMADRLANFKPSASAGVIGEAVDAQRPALMELMTPLERAFEQREAMRAQLKVCADTLGSLLTWSKEARELAQHTRMVAFNASIEAVRGTNGSPDEMAARQTISGEIRRVSESIIAMCDGMDQLLQPLHAATHTMQQEALIQDSNDEQLRLELELRARHAITAMFESLGGSISGGSDLLETSQALSTQMEDVFTGFQFGDRIEQMLQILNRDINRLHDFSGSGQQPTPQDIKRWLAELADSYTMDEQRSQHHNTELVDRSSRVEFF